jgi:pimeloyl-ACP methyl ester carboxylesterase
MHPPTSADDGTTGATRLVVVPGLGLDARSWAPVVAHLGLPVEVRTLPGYGRPAADADDLSPETLGRRLGPELAGDGGTVVLAGHSSGAQVAAHAARAARRAGAAVAGLVLVGPTTDPRACGWPRLAGRWLRTAAHEDPRQVPGLVRQYGRTGLRTMARAMDRARRDDVRAALADVSAPVLVVRGPDDRICPADWAASLARDVVTLRAGAHMVPSTHGADVAAAVLELVGAVDRRRP